MEHIESRVDQDIIDLYDEYTHVPLSRRVFLDRLTRLAGGTAAAAALLPLLETTGAEAAMIDPGDPRLETGYVTYQSKAGPIRAYTVRPKGAGRLPAVVVIHENRGLHPHIEDIARRIAIEGFLAVAPDALSVAGGTPKDQDQARDMTRKLNRSAIPQIFLGAIDYAASQGTGKVGTVGFCWGGGVSNQMAVRSGTVAAVVAYYGRQPAAKDVARIKAPLLLHYAGLDKRINAGIPAFEKALRAAGKTYTMYIYEGANHAFNNDANKARYNPAAAKLAWQRTIAFFKRNLG